MDNPVGNAKQAIVAAFVQGLNPKIAEKIQTVIIGWETKDLTEVLAAANHFHNKLERSKDSAEFKLMALQISQLQGPGRGRGRGRGRGGPVDSGKR